MNNNEENVYNTSTSLITSAGLSKTIPLFTERRYLDFGKEDIKLIAVDGPVKKDVIWMQIKKVSKPKEKDAEFFMTAIQKILLSCAMPDSRLLFLVTCLGNSDHALFLGIEGDNKDKTINMLNNFVSGIWPGIETKITDTCPQLTKLSNYIIGDEHGDEIRNFSIVTGIPSMETQYETIYPSTIDNLIEGLGNCNRWAYLVIAESMTRKQSDEILYTCRQLLGQIESLKSLSISDTSTVSMTEATKSIQNKDLDRLTNTICDIIPNFLPMKEQISKVLSGIIACLPTGVLLPTTTETSGSRQESEARTKSQTIVNNHIEAISEHLKKYANRLEEGKAIGMWEVNTFFMAKEEDVFNNGKQQLVSILSGDESKYEPIRVRDITNLFEDEERRTEASKFKFPNIEIQNKDDKVIKHLFGKSYDYLSSVLTTKELSSFINLPLKSVPGIPVREIAAFGRNITKSLPKKESVTTIDEPDSTILLGNIQHMGVVEMDSVKIDMNSLPKHTFITGTTGSGKSNTMYLILQGLLDKVKNDEEKKLKFLVIEPTKGEYKHVFGNKPGVSVYGSNPNINQLLRINPFEFPEGVHVYEHIDRLVEIFNASWPMYAAMPVVLKKAITDAYKHCGWDLHSSIQEINSTRKLFPTFNDVVVALRDFINNSEYSAETKGDYKGSLETRLISMSEGLTGMMLNNTKGNISDSDLFQKNVIVDLSRVGNTETKALIMGLLIMKMNEFYQTQGKMNSSLNHITVLEEAHNLLKRTSTAQNQESSNLAGKSVEMICNSIAEMRTYGEGFIIVDQSPSQVDLAAIRNTNTKIILSLPEADDRECAGKSIGLKDEQIDEIGRLKMGEAIVYQNGWEEPVLCKVNEFKYNKEERYKDHKDSYDVLDESDMLFKVLSFLYMYCGGSNDTLKQIDDLRCSIFDCKLLSAIKFSLLKLIDDYNKNGADLNERNHAKVMEIAGACLGLSPQIKKIIMKKGNITEANDSIKDLIKKLLPNDSDDFYRFCIRCSLRLLASESSANVDFYNNWFRTYYK